MLRTVEAKWRERQMAFEQLGRPALPFDEKGADDVQAAGVRQPPEQLPRGRRRPGPGIEK